MITGDSRPKGGWGGPYRAYAMSLFVSALIALEIFPVAFLLDAGPYWLAPTGDNLPALYGIHYFLADSWHFPPTFSQLIDWPTGGSVVYSGAPAAVALLDKLVYSLSGAKLTLFGAWYLLCYLLQGVAFVFLVRSVGARGWIATIAATVIALSFPAFLFRFFHIGLCAQFLIAFGLGAYVRARREPGFGPYTVVLFAVTWLALFIHMYLFAMDALLVAIFLLEEAWTSRRGLTRAAKQAAIFAVACGLAVWVLGYRAGGLPATGFGFFSMNLVSPLLPQGSGLFAPAAGIVDATGGQYEGYNYLGAGVLLLLIAAWAPGTTLLKGLVGKYRYLFAALIVLTLFALSDRIYYGPWLILPTPWMQMHYWRLAGGSGAVGTGLRGIANLASQFRSSGRFFWPVGYTLCAFGVAVVARRYRPRTAGALLLLAAGLQWIDAAPMRAHTEALVRTGGTFATPPAPWAALIGLHRHLTIVPAYSCVSGEDTHAIVQMIYDASLTATPTNTIYLARQRAPENCSDRTQEAVEDDDLMVLLTPQVSESAVMARLDASTLCRRFAYGFACSHQWDRIEAAGLAGGFETVAAAGR